MHRRLSFGTIVLHIVVITGALMTMLPIVWMIYSSFKTTTEIFRYPPWAAPEVWSFRSYISLFEGWSFRYWYVNSLVYAAVGMRMGLMALAGLWSILLPSSMLSGGI